MYMYMEIYESAKKVNFIHLLLPYMYFSTF